MQIVPVPARPTAAFVGASWAALFVSVLSVGVGLWNALSLSRSEKGFYAAVLVLGLFAAISLQKSVRDKAESVPVTSLYLGLAWAMVALSMLMMLVGLWNADMLLSEKGFYGLGFCFALFSAIAVQKNVRDIAAADAFERSQPGVPDVVDDEGVHPVL